MSEFTPNFVDPNNPREVILFVVDWLHYNTTCCRCESCAEHAKKGIELLKGAAKLLEAGERKGDQHGG